MGGGKTVSGKTAEPCLKTGREEADAVSTCGFHKGFQIQSIRKNVKVPEARFLILSLTRVKLQKYAAAAAAESLSRVRLCVTPQTAAHQAPPPLGAASHWSGLPFPSPMHESAK